MTRRSRPSHLWTVGLACLATLPGAGTSRADHLVEGEADATALRERYRALTEGWVAEATPSRAEAEAMARGRAWEDLMLVGLDDPLGRAILARGEPSYEALAAAYPGKVLDRAVLGTYSEPSPGRARDCDEEFLVWWNGAVSADLIERRLPHTIVPAAENTNLIFRVGPDAELFGADGDRASRIGYEDGFLPILTMTYAAKGLHFEQTAFAVRPGGPDREDVLYVRFRLANPGDEPRVADLHADVVLVDGGEVRAEGRALVNGEGALILAHDDPEARFDPERRRLGHRRGLGPGERAEVVYRIPYRPDPDGEAQRAIDGAIFRVAHEAVRREWIDRIGRGVHIEVPEPRVNDVWRALLVQNFLLADGPRMTYGSGMRYNRSYYPVESGLAGNVFALYGFPEYSHALLGRCLSDSLDRRRAGRKYQNRRGVAMLQLAENHRLTRLLGAYDSFRDDLHRAAEEIISDRRSTMVEPGGERPRHWGLLPPDRPGVDERASLPGVYVPAHNLTNSRGLHDLGRLLIRSGRDEARGRRYVEEAQEFRDTLREAMARSVIREEGRPPFVPLESLYFAETPPYGPRPYDHLALGRLQGAYYHYWADILLNFHPFDPGDPLGRWITDYLEARGGFVLGCTRARWRPEREESWISFVYNSGYYDLALRRDEIDRSLLGFYARLAFGMTRHALAAAESAPFIGSNTRDGGHVAADEPFPNSAAHAETLRMLRSMLVMEELRAGDETGDLFLARGAPRAWFRDGARIVVERAPTAFGTVSYRVESAADRGRIAARVEPPTRDPVRAIVLSLRHPAGAPIRSVRVDGAVHRDFDPTTGRVRLPGGPGPFEVEARYDP